MQTRRQDRYTRVYKQNWVFDYFHPFLTDDHDRPGRAVEVRMVEEDVSEVATTENYVENSQATDSNVSLSTKTVSEKKEENRVGASVQEETGLTETQNGPLSVNVPALKLVVENSMPLVKEKKSVSQEGCRAADPENGPTKVSICK